MLWFQEVWWFPLYRITLQWNSTSRCCSGRSLYGSTDFQGTGKSLSEALLFAEHWEHILCTKIVLNVRNNFCTQHVLPRFEFGNLMYWTCNSMNNLSSYCGLVDAKIGTSYKDLPAHKFLFKMALNFLAKFVVTSTVEVVFSCKIKIMH